MATWCKEPTHWKRPWSWERLKARGEGNNKGQDGWMASPTQWTWVRANSGRWRRTKNLWCCSPWGHKESDTTEWLNNQTIYMYVCIPCGSAGKGSMCNMGDLSLIPGLGRSLGEGKGYPLQYSGLENSMHYIVHGSHRVRHNWATFTFTEGINIWTLRRKNKRLFLTLG